MQPDDTIAEDQPLRDFIQAEVRRAFEKPESPRYPFPLSDAIECLFDILHHRLDDPDLDAVGNQVIQAIASYRERNDFLNLPDRLEAFLKFAQRLLKPATPARTAGTASQERMFLPEVLQAFGLANASAVGDQVLAQLEGKPRFAFHVERAVRARNEVHRAPTYLAREKAEIFESVCVVMLFTVCEFKEKLGLALLVSTQRKLLERYRDGFDKWRERFVELEGQEQLSDEFEGIDPLAVEVLDETEPAQDDDNEAQDSGELPPMPSQIADQRRGLVRDLVRTIPKLVLLGDPGSGKTTTLQYLAWHAASGLLKDPGAEWWFPIYLPLKTFASAGSSTIEGAIQSETESISLKQLAKQRCLFLLDGLNEVPQEHLLAAKHQIQSLFSLGDNVRVVMTCRPSQFQNEFGLPVFDLQPLTDEQIRHFFQRHLRDNDKVRRLMAIVKRQPKLWEWARNPFMLAMLVRVFLKNGSLPENRGSLMKAFLGDIMRREQVQGAARTALDTKTTLLARLAFETRKLALLSFSRMEACAWLKQRRDELGSTLDVPMFVDEVVNNNLVGLTSGGLLTFDHELYQEYFCAVALFEMGQSAVSLIKELQQEPRWEEPIIIYSGICDRRSSLLQALALVNVRLAAKCLTSAAVDEASDREIILLKAKELAAQAAEPSQVAEGLFSLAELGEAEAMITVLRQRPAHDAAASQAIQVFIPKCPSDLVIGWMQRTSDLSDKSLVSWMLAALPADQAETLLRDHPEALKELLLWQVKRSWQTNAEYRHLRRLLTFFGPEFRTWLKQSLAKDILARIDYGGDDQWQALKHLEEQDCELPSTANRTALFTAALNRCSRPSIDVAVSIWSQHLSPQNLSSFCQTVHEETLKRAMRILRKTKSSNHYRLSISFADALRSHLAGHLREDPRLLRTSTSRLEGLASMKVGEVYRNCRVTSLTDFGAFVELEPGNDALLHFTDLSWDPLPASPSKLEVNQQVDVVVLEIDDSAGNVLVGFKQMAFSVWESAQSKYAVGTKVKVTVLAVSNIAALVELEPGVQGIIAREELFWNSRDKPVELLTVGEEIEALVCGVDNDNLKFSLSTRLLEPDPWEEVDKLYPVGSTVSGKVTKLADFGGFIRLPRGIRGLLHVNDLTYGNLKHPSVLLKVGQELELMVLGVQKEKRRLNLGLKQRFPNPWDSVEAKYPAGTKVKGKVVNVVPYGAFVELEPGVEGLLHITELRWTKGDFKPKDVLQKDDEIEIVVLGINREEQKISLGIHQLEGNPWDMAQEKYPPGAKVKGKIRNLVSYGAWVELEEGLGGILRMSDISWTRNINHPSEVFNKGDEIEAVVLELDMTTHRLALGLKQLTPDPWEHIETYYQVGNVITGTVSRVASHFALVLLGNDIEGMVHISEVGEDLIDSVENVLHVGQEVKVRIISIDKAERRIGLSIKATKSTS